jgi:multicomponent K+:H+ antiporter subunit E
MRRWLPFPLLAAALAGMWLALYESLAPAHLAAAAALGAAAALAYARLQPPTGRVRRRAGAALRLAWLVLGDIVRSNIAVARIVLDPGVRGRTAGFLDLPLEVRHPGALALLACIVTATPGTSWARYDAAANTVTIHVLDLVDEQAWVVLFKQRYERLLKEIFE